MARDASKRLELLREVASRGDKLLIFIYQNPDPDALGAALALRKLLKKTRENCTITYTGKIGRPENAALIKFLHIPLVPFEPAMIQKHDLFAVVDAQPHFFKKSPELSSLHFNIVIDHHAREKGYSADFEDVRPSYGSASTIMTEYLRQSKVKMTVAVATALYYGLETDTASLQRTATDADIAAFRYLRNKTNMTIIRKASQSHFMLRSLDNFAAAIRRKYVVDDIIFSHMGEVDVADVCVHVADFFMEIYEIGWSIVSGIVDKTLVVVMRSDGYKKDVGALARDLFGDVGSAGGHKTMARAEIPFSNLDKYVQKTTNGEVEKYLLNMLKKKLKVLQKVVPR